MKAILVIDMPNDCYDCPLIYWGNIGGWNCKPTRALLDDANRKPEWCPLRPLPKRKKFMKHGDSYDDGFYTGFNTCLDEITGETE